MKFSKFVIPFFLILAVPYTAIAADKAVEEKIVLGLQKVDSNLIPDKISATKIPGLYEVIIGAEVIYASEDGNYILQGDMFELQEVGKVFSVTEETEKQARSSILKTLNQDDYIEFAPETVKQTLYVFTDITCGYCRKLHSDVPELNENGIAIRYLAYPRGGIESMGAFELTSVWCAEDRNKAMTEAKAGTTQDHKECDNPVAKEYKLGNSFGVSGTPAIFLENGFRVPGYLPPEKLIPMVEKESS